METEKDFKKKDRTAIAEGLGKVLANTFTLYLKTHKYHWDVTGPMFASLHTAFEVQYNELWLATDLIAERMRAIDAFAPGSYSEFQMLSSIKEAQDVPKAMDMIAELVADHETIGKTIRDAFKAAEAGDDEVTQDMLTQRLTEHEKTAWMLRANLEKAPSK